MLVALPDLLTPDDARGMVGLLESAGPGTAEGSPSVPNGMNLAVATALGRDAVFETVAAPRQVGAAAALRLGPGERHDYPADRIVATSESGAPLRIDLTVTVFLSPPDGYGGGDLVVLSETGPQNVRQAAGSALLCPASARRRVNEVTDGVRWSLDVPVQSMIRDEAQRDILAEMWSVMDWLDHMPDAAKARTDHALDALKRARTDLLRMWADI